MNKVCQYEPQNVQYAFKSEKQGNISELPHCLVPCRNYALLLHQDHLQPVKHLLGWHVTMGVHGFAGVSRGKRKASLGSTPDGEDSRKSAVVTHSCATHEV